MKDFLQMEKEKVTELLQRKHTKITFNRANGVVYEGTWKDGLLEGIALVTIPGHTVHRVEFENGKVVKKKNEQ